ncbi:MAG: hypothetical protein DIJKHBIC_02898 [Thermoanaerobaculia bacterium]|nr:hypothetical protein [Thermoanaerobaculia bacterium]
MTAKGSESKSGQIRALTRALERAESYPQWLEIATELDHIDGSMAWRENDASEFLHERLIREQIQELRALREGEDLDQLAALLQESVYRHLGELNNPELYLHARTGTKFVVTDYLDEVERAMHTLAERPIPGIPESRKLALFQLAERVYGRPALVLSGGASFGIYHLGVVKALWEARLLPRIISGSSMGAIVAAAVCNRTDEELDTFFGQITEIHRLALKWRNPREIWEKGSAMDERQLFSHILANVGSATFLEAHARTGRTLVISVSPTRTHQKPRVLNYLTAPDVLIEYATQASCAVPGLFPPVALKARRPGFRLVPYMSTETWIDGTVHGDLPRERLARLHNVNQTIVSQANPHVIPFITHRQERGLLAFAKQALSSLIHAGSAELLDIGRHLLDGTPLSPLLDQAHAVAAQTYLGDINIQFPFRPAAYLEVLSNPSPADLAAYVRLGEKATWPRITMIQDLTRISRAFHRSVEIIRNNLEADPPGKASDRKSRAASGRDGSALPETFN